MAKDAFYFSHDSNARNDPKCSALINDFGAEGYGVFWMMIEILSEQESYRLRKFNKLYEGLSRQLGIDFEALLRIIEALLQDYELLIEDNEFIWSESLLRRMEIKDEKKQKKIDAGRKGGIRSGVSRSSRTDDEANTKQNEAVLQANEPKEIKLNEIKLNEIKGKELKTSSYHHSPMNCFGMYEREIGDLTQSVSEKLIDLEEFYSEIWLKKAIDVAVFAGEKKIRFIEGTLKNWKNLNHAEPWTVDKPADSQKQGNVRTFKRDFKNNKPLLPVVQSIPSTLQTRTLEEREAMRKRAEMLDGA